VTRNTQGTRSRHLCPGVKEALGGRYDFDVNMVNKIFDLSPEELKKTKRCKWHNTQPHLTNECRVFKRHIQSAIDQGRIKFEDHRERDVRYICSLTYGGWW
jgi:acyl-CoA thioesterase